MILVTAQINPYYSDLFGRQKFFIKPDYFYIEQRVVFPISISNRLSDIKFDIEYKIQEESGTANISSYF